MNRAVVLMWVRVNPEQVNTLVEMGFSINDVFEPLTLS